MGYFGNRLREPMGSWITQPVPVRESFPSHVKIMADPGPESTFKRLQMMGEMLKMETIISRLLVPNQETFWSSNWSILMVTGTLAKIWPPIREAFMWMVLTFR